MPDVIVNVAPQQTASVEVDVDNVASYYYDLAKQWAISPDLVEFLDYSSKHYAFVSKGYKEEVDALLSDSGFIAVKNDLANIDTVADSIANVNTTAGNITNINTVADISSNITTVAGISTDITAVNNNATNINACVDNATNINAVASNATNINTVAGDKTNIDTVAGNTSNINTVAGISTDVTGVASISSAVSAVNTNASNINAVSNDLTNINSVASDLTNIDSVAGMSSAITTVNSNSTNINTCATSIGNINTCAANISTIADKVNKSGDTMTGDLTLKLSKLNFLTNFTTTPFADIHFDLSYPDSALTLKSGFANTSAEFTIHHNEITSENYITASTGLKQSITNWSFPSTTYTDLSSQWTVSGFTVTAPANGWLQVSIDNAGDGFILLSNLTSGLTTIVNNMGTVGLFGYLPAAKNDILRVDYSGTSTLNLFGFRHAIGG